MMLLGHYFYTRHKGSFYNALSVIIFINYFILVAQFLGIADFLHSWNSLFSDETGRRIPIQTINIFFNSSADGVVAFQQVRSPGILHSNAITSVFMMLMVAHFWGGKRLRVSFLDVAIVTTIITLGSKIGIAFLFIFIFAGYFIFNQRERLIWGLRFALASVVLALYYWMFPVLGSILTWNVLLGSSLSRIYDFLGYYGLVSLGYFDVIEGAKSIGFYISDDDIDLGGRSGIRQLLAFVVICVFYYLVNRKKLKSIKKSLSEYEYRRSASLGFAVLFSMLATPILGVHLLFFIAGPALAIVFRPDLSRRVVTR